MRTNPLRSVTVRYALDLLLAAALIAGCGGGANSSGSGGTGGRQTGGASGSGAGAGGSSATGGSAGSSVSGGSGGSAGESTGGTGGSGGDDAGTAMDATPPEDSGAPSDGGTVTPPPSGQEMPPACINKVDVANSMQLASALSAAKPGDCLTLADGDYAFPAISAKGTEALPILVTAANLLKATISSSGLDYEGAEWVTVQGLTVSSATAIKLNNCQHCRLTRNRLQLKETVGGADHDWVTVTGTSNNCRVDHNDFGPHIQIGNMIMLAGAGPQIVQNTRIDHNFFHDVKMTSGNGWETIRGGLSSWWLSIAHSLIERNLFERTDGNPEVISIKSSQNVIRWNTMRNSNGEFVLRHGNGSEMYGNFIFGEGAASPAGIRVHGGNHRVYNNYIAGVKDFGINLEGGEHDDNSGAATDHKQVYNVQVLFNTVIGSVFKIGGSHPMDPKNCTIANNLVSGAAITMTSTSMNNTLAGNIVTGTGGVTTGVRNVDPKLMQMGDLMLLTAGSPALGAADPMYTVMDDISGLPRMAKLDVGAEQMANWSNGLATEGAPNGPLTDKDVGPLSP